MNIFCIISENFGKYFFLYFAIKRCLHFLNDICLSMSTLEVVFRHLSMKMHFMSRSLSIDQMCDAILHADNKWLGISVALLHTHSFVSLKQLLTFSLSKRIFDNMCPGSLLFLVSYFCKNNYFSEIQTIKKLFSISKIPRKIFDLSATKITSIREIFVI